MPQSTPSPIWPMLQDRARGAGGRSSPRRVGAAPAPAGRFATDRGLERLTGHVQQDLRPGRQLRLTRTARSPTRWRSARRSTPKLVGCHVYAARMHDYRFKQMEYTLPDEYLDEIELERQRKIHDSLITLGLKLISESYLDQMQNLCRENGLDFEPRMMDGKHHTELIRDIAERRLRPGGDRRARHRAGARQRDRLGLRARGAHRATATSGWSSSLPKKDEPQGDTILVGIDGSPQSFGALQTALELGQAVRQEGRDHRRLRPLPPLLGLPRHRRRAVREGLQGVPLRGAEPAPRGDHRHRPGADLPVAPRRRRAHGARRRHRGHEDAARRQGVPEDPRPRAQDQPLAAGRRTDRRPQPGGRDRPRQQHREPAPPLPLRRPALDRARLSRTSTCAPRRASSGRRRPRSA